MRPKLEKAWDVLKAQASKLEAQQLALEGAQNRGSTHPHLCAAARPACPTRDPQSPLPIPGHTVATGFPFFDSLVKSLPSPHCPLSDRAEALECAHCLSPLPLKVAESLAEKLRLEQELVGK